MRLSTLLVVALVAFAPAPKIAAQDDESPPSKQQLADKFVVDLPIRIKTDAHWVEGTIRNQLLTEFLRPRFKDWFVGVSLDGRTLTIYGYKHRGDNVTLDEAKAEHKKRLENVMVSLEGVVEGHFSFHYAVIEQIWRGKQYLTTGNLKAGYVRDGKRIKFRQLWIDTVNRLNHVPGGEFNSTSESTENGATTWSGKTMPSNVRDDNGIITRTIYELSLKSIPGRDSNTEDMAELNFVTKFQRRRASENVFKEMEITTNKVIFAPGQPSTVNLDPVLKAIREELLK
ncbi:MAG: hypothetical protein ACJ8C4_15150 [Gemmataceae bacterium]